MLPCTLMACEDTAGPESGIQFAGIVILLAVHTVLILNHLNVLCLELCFQSQILWVWGVYFSYLIRKLVGSILLIKMLNALVFMSYLFFFFPHGLIWFVIFIFTITTYIMQYITQSESLFIRNTKFMSSCLPLLPVQITPNVKSNA